METCLGVDSDIISNLPGNVIDQILVRLPINHAVRTSILSSKWRYKWTTIPQLVFKDDELVKWDSKNKEDKVITFIDRVLLFHSGFIHKFELSTGVLRNNPAIDCWILFLSRKNIKEFVLKFHHLRHDERYKLPTCFFSAQKMISTLELSYCVLKPPPTFTGFNNLKSLYLHETTIASGVFECLISKCPVLERLIWKMFDSAHDHLNICSPNLKYLYLSGTFEGISFVNTPLLSDVNIYWSNFLEENFNKLIQSGTGNVVKVLSSLPSLRKLVVPKSFLKFLAAGEIPEKLPLTCHHLTSLSLDVNTKCTNDLRLTLCLLNSSPNLRELQISSYILGNRDHDLWDFWEAQTHIDWSMNRLHFVKITDVYGIKFQLPFNFIKLLLAKSPMLEMLSIISFEIKLENRGCKLLRDLLRLQRASPKAVIEFVRQDDADDDEE